MSFSDWYKNRELAWYLGWWDEEAETSVELSQKAKEEGHDNVEDHLNMKEGNWTNRWILMFKVNEDTNKVSHIKWFRCDFYTKMKKADNENAYDSAYPFQLAQWNKLSNTAAPPFDLKDKEFKAAFKKAMEELSEIDPSYREGSPRSSNCKPSKKLLDLIYRYMYPTGNL